MVFTKEQITPACLDLFRDALKKLPATIPERLASSRAVRNHRNYRYNLVFASLPQRPILL